MIMMDPYHSIIFHIHVPAPVSQNKSLGRHDLPSPRIAFQEPIRMGIQAVDGKKPVLEGTPMKTIGKPKENGGLMGFYED